LDQSFGHFLVNPTVLASWRTQRQVQGVSGQLGVQLQGLVGVGYVFDNEMSVALVLGESWRLQGGLSYNSPVGSLGWNQTAGLRFT